MSQFKIIKPHRAKFENPIKVRAGEKVELGKIDEEYPGWIWITTTNGNSGWGPRELLSIDGNRGSFVCDYDATELTLDEGARVMGLYEVSGWIWCRTEDGKEGWVPEDSLSVALDAEDS